jgi:translation initiation factor 2B subunit (eIF-2B alpha/beta/delta family)
MDADQRLDALIAPLRADVVSGASVLGKKAAEVLGRAATLAQAVSLEEFRSELGEVSGKVLDAQPAMATLVTLVRDVLDSVEACADLEAGRQAAVRTAEAFGSGLDLRAESIATHAAALIPSGATVATISSSSTVQATLTHEGARAFARVICFESRPMREGEILATALAEAGVAVTFAVDAAASTLIGECDIVLLGADSIGDLGVVNKIGSAGLVDAAIRQGVPVMVASDETKILPTGFPQHLTDDRPPEEVWRAPAGVRVWNRYFEPFELERVTMVVTESDALTAPEVEALRKDIVLPPGLRAWADARAPRSPEA